MFTRLVSTVFPLTLAALASTVLAQNPRSPDGAGARQETINAMCPIGKEPVVPSAGTVEYKGHAVGLCCPGCGKQFLAWDEQRKDEFIQLALAKQEPGQRNHAPQDEAEKSTPAAGAAPGPSYPYTLDSCPVGGTLGSMGEPVVREYGGREVRFCCAGCIGDFEANQSRYWGEIDKKIISQQLMHYPIDTCIVTGATLGADALNHVHNNRLIRLADDEALKAFRSDTAKFLKALDEKIIDTQLPDYPMTNCPVGGPLGSMGEPVNFIYMNRLVRFCCGGCERSLLADPAPYMAKLDRAYADAQHKDYPLDTCVVSGEQLGSMGEPVELVAGTTLVRFCCDNCVPKFQADPAAYLKKIAADQR